MLKFLLFAFVVGCATALTVPCRSCNSKGVKQSGPVTAAPSGTCKTVSIEPCATQPCDLKKGTNVTFSVSFTAGLLNFSSYDRDAQANQANWLEVNHDQKLRLLNTQAATSLTSEVYGVINNVPVKFSLPNPNGCVDSGIRCPLVAGQTYTYTDALYISKLYPQINLVVKWSLLDQNNNPIFCVVVPAKISNN